MPRVRARHLDDAPVRQQRGFHSAPLSALSAQAPQRKRETGVAQALGGGSEVIPCPARGAARSEGCLPSRSGAPQMRDPGCPHPSLPRKRGYHVHTSLSGASRLPKTSPPPGPPLRSGHPPHRADARAGGISPRFVVSRESQTAAATSIPPPARQRGGEGGSSERSEDEPGGGSIPKFF